MNNFELTQNQTWSVSQNAQNQLDANCVGVKHNHFSREQRMSDANQSSKNVRPSAELAQILAGEREHAVQLELHFADLSAVSTVRGMLITFGNDMFGTDLAPLNPAGIRATQKLANLLQHHPQRKVLVEGFSDSAGSSSHNQELSERRAIAVRSALQELGVARGRVSIRGYGDTYPIAANDTLQNRQLNRRVEIVLSDPSGKIAAR